MEYAFFVIACDTMQNKRTARVKLIPMKRTVSKLGAMATFAGENVDPAHYHGIKEELYEKAEQDRCWS